MSPKKRSGAAPSYKARAGSHISDKQAVVVGRFCDRLARKYGAITAEKFVEEAQTDSTVRDFLEWDNGAAAAKWRLHQARVLIGSITVIVTRNDRKVEVRGLQHVNSQGGYVPAAKVFADDDMRREVVERAKREAVSWFHRYQHVRSFDDVAPVFDAIEKTMLAEVGANAAAE